MRTFGDSDAQQSQSTAMRQAAENRAQQETAYLMQSPENARRLVDAIKDLKAGKGIQRDLME
ncbi:type II toxin-antitoxin system Phd/YefM family antitoxin [Kluyvera sp. CHPC 1.2972]|uniref:type II toxin-antitoxin system prevent-host-death family antitoxin n=1 Tax=Kluyvera sp. CHPC 1.2972 TaxID=2995176 RepID=UPI002FD803CC